MCWSKSKLLNCVVTDSGCCRYFLCQEVKYVENVKELVKCMENIKGIGWSEET